MLFFIILLLNFGVLINGILTFHQYDERGAMICLSHHMDNTALYDAVTWLVRNRYHNEKNPYLTPGC